MNTVPAAKSKIRTASAGSMLPIYPLAAIVGQEEMKLALLLNIIDSSIGGVLIMGHRGTGKSTAVRSLADLLPPLKKVRGCAYGCDASEEANLCVECLTRKASGEKLRVERTRVPVVDLPLGATEDRVCGTINIERALTQGVKAFEPGLLARANRGFLYIDEVNLLEDHLVDLLLDVAVTGRNLVEREGISVEHPARFVLVGSGNPEEGELRPQLLDRFGLHVEIKTLDNLDERLEIILRREAFERDAQSFCNVWEAEQEKLRRKLARARKALSTVKIDRALLRRIAELCLQLKIDGHRGELSITRAARALAAFEGRRTTTEEDVRRVAAMSLRHRVRRDPLEQTGGGARIEQALENLFPAQAEEDRTGKRELSEVDDDPGDTPTDFSGGAELERRWKARETNVGHEAPHHKDSERESPPAIDTRLPSQTLDIQAHTVRKQSAQISSARHHSNTGRRSYNTRRGRYARAVMSPSDESKIALDATLRAAAQRATFPVKIGVDSLRYKRFRKKAGTLFIFAVDTSGSMALNRINQAKGALARVLQQSYIRRDRVALIVFREAVAEVLLPPCQSMTRAKRLLDALRIGGATPLSAGLAASLRVAESAARRGTERIVLLVFTDGQANVPLHGNGQIGRTQRERVIAGELTQLGDALARARVSCVVVDTRQGYASGGAGAALADRLRARYLRLPSTIVSHDQELDALTL
jgi:magnesium chelatase ATPase subunit I